MNMLTKTPKICAKSLKYKTMKALLKTVGRSSEGISIGWKYGFDSGESLDYVYENQARGVGVLGKVIDRFYLNSAGWRGIRIRGKNMQKALDWAIERHGETPETIRIMDIASGPGRYLLDMLKRSRTKNLSVRCCDMDEVGLEAGRQKAKELGLENVTFEKRDAFAKPARKPEPTTDIAIVSGLYELFADNEMVSRSLQVLSDSVKEGAYLIYTNQPWHPQLEFISRVLTNRNGEPWVMRCRSQNEMDELVKQAGFVKQTMFYDEQGIFTVSIATKRSLNISPINICA